MILKFYFFIKILLILNTESVASQSTFLKTQDLQFMHFDYRNEDVCIGNCQKLDFIVNFTEIGWEKWILYPKTFNAYYCSGQCPVPLKLGQDFEDGDAQVTNHAQIMSILEFINPIVNRKMTSCVPTKLEPLEIVTLNEAGEIEMRKYENMIVKQCGCR